MHRPALKCAARGQFIEQLNAGLEGSFSGAGGLLCRQKAFEFVFVGDGQHGFPQLN